MKYENIMIPHLKKSLCNLPTRRFGEFVEILTSKLNNLENSIFLAEPDPYNIVAGEP